MKRGQKPGLVHVPRGTGTYSLARDGVPSGRRDVNPAAVYLGKLSKGSVPTMRSSLRIIARMVAPDAKLFTLPWHELRFQHTARITVELKELYKPRAANKMIAAMRGVLKAAWRLGLMDSDDYHRAVDLEVANTSSLPPAGRYIEEDEVAELIKAAASRPAPLGYRDQALVVALYAGGLRRADASGLDIDGYNPEDGCMSVTGKGGKYRTTYIAEGYRAWVAPWHQFLLENGRANGPMFVRFKKQGPTDVRLTEAGISKILGEISELAKVKDVSPHDLRRSFGTLMLDRGADLLIVQQLMGHASADTTRIYDRRGEAGKRKAVQKFPVVLSYADYLRSKKT